MENENGIKIITDPYTKVGYELPKGLQADILTISHGHFDHSYHTAVETKEIIAKSGEYEYFGIKIQGSDFWHDPKQGALRGNNILFKYEIDGVKVCHFGDLGEEYSSKIEQFLKDTDIWLIPVGGTYTIDAVQAKYYIEKLKPKTVIPMHYLPDDGCLDIAKAEVFLSIMKEYETIMCLNGSYCFNDLEMKGGATKILYMERMKAYE